MVDFKPQQPKPEKPLKPEIPVSQSNLRDQYKQTYEGKAIVIKIMPRTLERFIFGLVVLILILVLVSSKGFVFDLPSFGSNNHTDAPKEQQASTEKETAATEQVQEEKKEEPKEEIKKEPELTPAEKLTNDEIKKDLTFDFDITYNKTKVETITFTIVNGNVDILPRVKVFWYDADSTDERKSFERGVATYMIGLRPKQSWTSSLKETNFKSKYFESTTPTTEVVRLDLFDMKTNKLLLSQTKTVTVDAPPSSE